MTLVQKVAKGIMWTGSSAATVTLLNFGILAVLARLLSPSDFGLMGMVMVVTGFATMIADLGLGSAVIQRQNVTHEQISTFFFLNIIFGIVLGGIVYFTSGLIEKIFKTTDLVSLLKVISFSFLIISLGQTFRTLLVKWMNFKKLAMVEVSGIFIYGISSITLAVKGFGVWSLVIGFLVRQIGETVLLWIFTAFKPQLFFNLKKVKNLFNFGIYVFGERIFNYFNRNLDYIIIGFFLGAEALGFYTLAYQLMLFPLFKISHVILKVIFPAFSRIQNENKKMRDGYLKIVKYISLATFPMMVGIFVVAPEFINVIYGAKWQPTVLVLQILCLVGIFQSIGTTVGTIQYAKGRPDIGFKWNLFTLCFIATAFFVGVKWGIVGVAVAYTLVSIILSPIIQSITNRLIELKWKDFLKQFINPTMGSMLIIVVVFSLKIFLLNRFVLSQFAILISSVLLGVGVYTSFIYLKERKLIFESFKNLSM